MCSIRGGALSAVEGVSKQHDILFKEPPIPSKQTRANCYIHGGDLSVTWLIKRALHSIKRAQHALCKEPWIPSSQTHHLLHPKRGAQCVEVGCGCVTWDIYIFTYVCIDICIYVCVYMYVCIVSQKPLKSGAVVSRDIYIYIYIYICICIDVYIYICVCICIHRLTKEPYISSNVRARCVCVCTWCIYIYTYIYMYRYIYICVCVYV